MGRVSSLLAVLITIKFVVAAASGTVVPAVKSEYFARYLSGESSTNNGRNTTMAALLAFKQAMLPNDPTRFLATMWNSSSSPDYCQWPGIRCSDGTHDVIALLLDSHQFVGTLPPQLGQLSHLVYLNVSNNSFSGSIPREFGGLSSLTHLDLSDNQLSGTIPSSLANCTRLQLLDLRINHLSGKFPSFLTGFSDLIYLDLSENSFPGEPMPPDIGRLSNLEFLQIYKAGLAGRLPLSITNCTRLVWLHLQGNNLTGMLAADWSGLSRVVHIHLLDNLLSGSIPASLGNCTTLLHLALGTNSLTGELPASLGRLGLQYLVVNYNHISGLIPTSYANLTQLISLQFGYNNLTGTIPSDLFAQMKKLIYLGFLGNPRLSGELPHTIGECVQLQMLAGGFTSLGGPLPTSLYNLSSLQSLGLSASGFSGSLPEDVLNLTALEKLRLGNNTFHGGLPAELGALAELQELELHHNHFEGPIPRLWRSNALLHIDLSFNSLTGAVPAELGQFKRLNYLYLQNNRLSGNIPDVFDRSLPDLLHLNVSHNQLTGPAPQSLYVSGSLDLSFNNLSGLIPDSLGNMRMVSTIRLAGNRFTGQVPSSLSSCQGLEALDLSSNNLGGEIPSALELLVVLQYLNLSHNNLSGGLPQSLGSLRNLVSLDVSYNALQGKIPSIGAYQNSSAAAFKGNPGLCGHPLDKSCVAPPASHRSSQRWTRIVIVSLSAIGGVVMMYLVCCVCVRRCLRSKSLLVGGSRAEPFWDSNSEKWPLRMQNLDLREWTARELWVATNGFNDANRIGSGGASVCFKAMVEDVRGTKRLVAVKRLKGRSENQREDQRSFAQELSTLCKVRHRNLVSTLGYCMDEGVAALVLEFMENGNLDEHLHGGVHESLSWGERLQIAVDVAEGLVYLHHEYLQPIIHCDLKPVNILLGSDMVAKISDFGIARFLERNETGNFLSTSNFRGTFGYAAPECAVGMRISTKADVYSFGVLLLELVTGMSPVSPQLQACGISLHKWAREILHKKNMEASLLDTALQHSIDNDPLGRQQLKGLLDLGVKCTSDVPKMRPNMKYVRETLLNITKPEPISHLDIQALLK